MNEEKDKPTFPSGESLGAPTGKTDPDCGLEWGGAREATLKKLVPNCDVNAELLEACKNAIVSQQENPTYCWPGDACGICWICQLQAAIAKAERPSADSG
jgi:hypothetical protein